MISDLFKIAVGMDGVKNCILNDILVRFIALMLFRASCSYQNQITSLNTVTSTIIMD